MQTIDPDDANGEDDEDDDAQYYAVGDKTLRISTAHTEEKNNALNMLACYAEHLQARTMPVDCVVLERSVKRCYQHVCPLQQSTCKRAVVSMWVYKALQMPTLEDACRFARPLVVL